MSKEQASSVGTADHEVFDLIEALLAAEERLHVLTGGQVDSVAGRDGSVFLLRRAQEQVLRGEAAKQASVLRELRVLFDLLPAMIWFKDTENRILRINQRAAEAVGRSIDEIEGKSCWELFPDQAARFYATDLEVIQSGAPKLGFEEEIPGPAAGERWFRTDIVPYSDKEGRVIGIVVLSVDITEHRRLALAQRELTEETERRERMFTAALASMTDFAQIYDGEGRILFVNQPLLDLWGLTLGAVVGKNFFDLNYPRELALKLQGQLRDVWSTRKRVTDETPYVSPTGEHGYYEYIFSPALGPDGEVELVIGTTRDITERKLGEQRLQRLNRLHGVLSHVAGAALAVRSQAELYETVCRTFVQLTSLRFAFIVQIKEESRPASPVICFGEFESEIPNVEEPLGSGPLATALRTNSRDHCNSIGASHQAKPWLDFARTNGFLSVAAFPLKLGAVTVAVLVLYSGEEGYFKEDELRLIDSVASSVSLAVEAIDREHQRELAIIERNNAHAALHRSLAETERQVEQRTAELAEANAELQLAIKRADAANQAKSEFLSNMSHELRTPLNAVLGNAQLLELQYTTPYIVESARSIIKGGDHLLRMINEILDLSQIESGRATISIEPVSLTESIGNAIELVRPLAARAGVDIEWDHEIDEELHVEADSQRLVQVLVNLLSNAIKYNRPQGRIVVDCEVRTDARTRIAISDTGHGIDPQVQHLLFQPFQRLGERSIEGTGLGLVLSKRFVEMVGGSLELTASSPEGSTFTIELNQCEGRHRDQLGQVAESVPIQMVHRRGTILLIEDNLSNLGVLEMAFSLCEGLTLIPAMQGTIGIELARVHLPDVILLDLHLPDIMGIEVLTRLKSDRATQAIPVVVVSADATRGTIRKVREAGAEKYLSKPINLKQLFELLDEILPEGG